MVPEVSEVERREELKVVAGVALVQCLQGPDQGQSRAQSLGQDQGLARNLDPESPDPGQPADQGPGVDPRGLEVDPRGQEVDPRGQEVDPRGRDPDRPSQSAVQGLALAVQQGQGQRVEQSQGQEVQGNQDPGVRPNLDPEVQQGQGLQAHQGQGQGLPEAIETNHQFNAQAMCCYCLYRVDSSAPISSVESYFWLS